VIAGRTLSSGRVNCTTAAVNRTSPTGLWDTALWDSGIWGSATVAAYSIPAGGLYFDTDGKLHVAVSGTIAQHVNGLPVTATGQLVVNTSGTPSDIGVGGLRICTDGRLHAINNGTPAFGVGGLPVNSAGALVATGAA